MKNAKLMPLMFTVICAPSIVAAADEWGGLNVGGSIELISEDIGSGSLTQISSGLVAGYNYSLGNNIVVGGDVGLGFGAYTATLKAGYALDSLLLFGSAGLMDVESGFEPVFGAGVGFKPSENTIITGEYLMGSGTVDFLAVTEEYDASSFRVSYALQF
jgi:hypothetical protein